MRSTPAICACPAWPSPRCCAARCPTRAFARIDSSKASALPGVLAILSRDTIAVASNSFGAYVRDQQIVATDKVRYVGDMVAAVAAVDGATAQEAVSLIEVDYEELPAVFSIEEALKQGAPLVHEGLERRDPGYGRGGSHIVHDDSNICLHFRHEKGDVAAGFQQSDLIFEDTFHFPSAQHYPMEPHVCVAHFEGDVLTVWSATQSPFPVRQELARLFGLPFSAVRVIVPSVGGGYGAKSGIKTEGIAGCLSKMTGRPVKLAFGAEETFKTICQPRAKMTLKTGVKKDGTFVARHCEVYLDGGAYANSGPSVTEKAGYRAHGPYRLPVCADQRLFRLYQHRAWRCIPRFRRAAGGLRLRNPYRHDRSPFRHGSQFEIRMKNLLDKGESFSPADTPIDCDLKAGLRSVAQAIGWDARPDSHQDSGPKRRGIGIATAMKDGGGTNKPANASVKIFFDGSALLSTGSVEVGQGMRTAFLQVVAEELSMPTSQVRVAALDTHYTPFDKGTNASSATSIMGQAVLKAARDARRQFIEAAATVLKAPIGSGGLDNGVASYGEQRLSFREVMQRHFRESEGEIWGRGYFKIEKDKNVPLGFPSPFWEIGFGAAEVEVDVETGEVKLLRYVSLTDAGKMINPLQCHGQDEGAAVFGLGQALFEDLAYQDGQLLNGSLIDYRLPRFSDLPPTFSTYIMEGGGGPGPYGAKGMGEGGILPVAPAVGNAVFAATGVRIQAVPLVPEVVRNGNSKNRKE